MNSKELEKTLWATAKKLRISSDPAAGMHMVLGLIFLRYITDVSNENLVKDEGNIAAANAENYEEYLAYNEYFIPKKAQWNFLRSNAGKPDIGETIDVAIDLVEKLNANMKGFLPKNFSNPDINKALLTDLIIVTGNIGVNKHGNKNDSLSHAFEYLLRRFAEAEGKKGNEFYTPESIAKLLAGMAEPRKGKVYDGCCGTGSMFVQSEKFTKKRKAKVDDLTFYGQDNNEFIITIARMNMAIHGIDANLQVGDSFTNDCYPALKADFILANPPVNRSGYRVRLTDDKRRKYGVPSEGNTNYAWLQHFFNKLAPAGTAGIILGKDSLHSTSVEERQVRKNLIEAGLIDCIVVLPSQLFYSTKKPACIWLLSGNRTNNKYRNAGKEILFINAGKLGVRDNGEKRELTDENILLITKTYHRWRNINGDYIDIKGFCKAVSTEEISKNRYTLLPEKYIPASRIKKISLAFLSIIFLALFYFLSLKNGLFTDKPLVPDTAIIIQPGVAQDSLPVQKKISKTVKVNEVPVKVNDSAVTKVQKKPFEGTQSIEKDVPAEVKEAGKTISYKVISKAYFYDEPDETTKRRSFIIHWNNTYADIKAIDEKNGFVYVVFTNHLNQTSKGWLRKKDLKEVSK